MQFPWQRLSYFGYCVTRGGDAFLSKVNLCKLKSLKLQRIGWRFTGLLIHRIDKLIDILGQCRLDNPTNIYGQGDMSLPIMVTFIYSTLEDGSSKTSY